MEHVQVLEDLGPRLAAGREQSRCTIVVGRCEAVRRPGVVPRAYMRLWSPATFLMMRVCRRRGFRYRSAAIRHTFIFPIPCSTTIRRRDTRRFPAFCRAVNWPFGGRRRGTQPGPDVRRVAGPLHTARAHHAGPVVHLLIRGSCRGTSGTRRRSAPDAFGPPGRVPCASPRRPPGARAGAASSSPNRSAADPARGEGHCRHRFANDRADGIPSSGRVNLTGKSCNAVARIATGERLPKHAGGGSRNSQGRIPSVFKGLWRRTSIQPWAGTAVAHGTHLTTIFIRATNLLPSDFTRPQRTVARAALAPPPSDSVAPSDP